MYKRLTLQELIDALRALPAGSRVTGLDASVYSYRGYYERNAIAPDNIEFDASALADIYESEIGRPIFGYKGGDYKVDRNQLVYLAGYGSTGPSIIGLELLGTSTDMYIPTLLSPDYY